LICQLNSYAKSQEVGNRETPYPWLHREHHATDDALEGVFLVRVDRPSTVGIRNGRFTFCGSQLLNRENIRAVHSPPSLLHPQSALETPLVPAGFSVTTLT